MPRVPVMVRVAASWQNESGVSRDVLATLEDRSPYGVAVHIAEQLPAGSRLQIKSPTEEFAGVVIYCRRLKKGFILGIQRIPASE